MERHLGARLFHRTTRSLSLTEPGRLAYEHAVQVARSAQAARSAVESLTSEPRGLLRVTTSVAYGRSVLLDLAAKFLRLHAQVQVDVLLLDRMVDFAEERVDLAVRLAHAPPDLSIATALRPIEYLVVAARGSDLVRQIAQPADLRNVDVLTYTRDPRDTQWRFNRAGESEEVRTTGRMSVNNSEGIADLVAAGVGAAVVPDYIAAPLLRARKLVRVLPQWQVEGRFGTTVWLVRPPDRAVLPAVRAFADFLAAELSVPR